ncbi:cpw-wpc domain-containing protein, partial [Cystoisospora suis]
MERPSWGIPFLGCTIAIIAAFSVSCVADLHAIRPFDDVDLDATTSRLLDSFARLVNDSANVANKSEFTQLLSDAALRVIYNVPPALVTQKVATQTEEAASRMALPNPDDEGCTARDYSAMCPMDFYDAGDGKTCKALPTYAGKFCPTQTDATAMEKRVFAARCKTN